MSLARAAAVAAAMLVLVGCSGEDGGEQADVTEPTAEEQATDEPAADEPAAYSDACGAAVAQAAAVGEMEEAVENLDPAMTACASIDELQAAADDHPGALDVDAATWAANRCLSSDDGAVLDSAICAEVAVTQ